MTFEKDFTRALWNDVHHEKRKPDVNRLMYVCGPLLWAGQPGYALAAWDERWPWYHPEGKWSTVDGVELNADEITHWFIPLMPSDKPYRSESGEFPL